VARGSDEDCGVGIWRQFGGWLSGTTGLEQERLEKAQRREWIVRNSRVDVVDIEGCRVLYEWAWGKDSAGAVEVACRFEDGTRRRLLRHDFAAYQNRYPVGARLSLRWFAEAVTLAGAPAGAHAPSWTGDGTLLNEPGPPTIPGRSGSRPTAEHYLVRVFKPWAPGDGAGDLMVDTPLGATVRVTAAEFGLDAGDAADHGRAFIRYDWEHRTFLEIIPC
jgi:hypothetical protein